MAVPDDRQKPRLRIGASKTVKGSIGAQDGLLHEIIGITRRGREPAGKSIGGVQMRQNLRLEATAPVTHRSVRALHVRRQSSLHTSYKTLGASDLFPSPRSRPESARAAR